MKYVDIITSEMHQIHGANRVTEKLISGKHVFESRGFHLRNLLSQDGILDCQSYTESVLGSKEEERNYQKARSTIEQLKRLPFYKSYLIQKSIQNRAIQKNNKVLQLIDDLEDVADIVIFQDPFAAYKVLRKKKNEIKSSILISHAATDPLEQLLINRPALKETREEQYLRNLLKFVFLNVSAVVTICRSSQEYMKSTYGLNCPCIINGIEDVNARGIKKISEEDHKIHIAIVASVQFRKGQDLALQALSQLNEEKRDRFVLHLVGDGNGMDDIRKMIDDLKLQNNVVLHGLCRDVSKILYQMDIFMLPSRADTVPVAIIEALRAGLPTFATYVGEIPHMLDGCGEVFAPNTEEILKIYHGILDGRYDLAIMSQDSRKKYLREFNLDSMILKYCDVLDRIEDIQ